MQITAVVTKAITTDDPEVKCVETVTEGFVKRVYKTLAQCRKAETPKQTDTPRPTGADAATVKVDGDTATALVRVKGGQADGAGGLIRFAKADGKWKVDDLDVTFLRSQLTKGLAKADTTQDAGPLADPTVRACVLKAFGALDDRTFKAIAFNGIAETPPDPRFVSIVNTCTKVDAKQPAGDTSAGDGPADTGPSPVSGVRRQFEKGLRASAGKSAAGRKKIDCVIEVLRKTATDAQIVREIGKGTSEFRKPTNPLTRKLTSAIASC